jgi:hypothetical protein
VPQPSISLHAKVVAVVVVVVVAAAAAIAIAIASNAQALGRIPFAFQHPSIFSQRYSQYLTITVFSTLCKTHWG